MCAVIGAVLLVAGCEDGTGPEVVQPISVDLPETGQVSNVDQNIVVQSDAAPPLETYELSFWAFRGASQEITIHYLAGETRGRSGGADDYEDDDDEDDDEEDEDDDEEEEDDDEGDGDDGESGAGPGRFLSFYIPKYGLRRYPDGTRFATGDSVEITITVDPERFLVSLEPSGLVFSAWSPARLNLWYSNADDDYDGDGDDDDDDESIQNNRLALWVQQDTGGKWHRLDADHFVFDELLSGYLRHFSNYAASW